MKTAIPVYRADGQLYDVVTETGLVRLQSDGLIARVVRHRKGHINRAIMFASPCEAPLQRTAYMGSRYSYLQKLEHGVCWDLKRLGGGRGGVNYAPDDVRPIFLAVLLSCLVRNRRMAVKA